MDGFNASLCAPGLSAMWPNDPDWMLTTIRLIKAKSATPNARNIRAETVSELTLNGSSLLLIVCFEFSLLTKDLIEDVFFTDIDETLTTTSQTTP